MIKIVCDDRKALDRGCLDETTGLIQVVPGDPDMLRGAEISMNLSRRSAMSLLLNRCLRLESSTSHWSVVRLAVVLGFLSGSIVVVSDASAQMGMPVTVRADEVRSESLQPRHQVTGSLRAISRADVASQENGRVEQVPINEGQRVEQGQVLATLDARRIYAQIHEIEAAKRTTQARIRQLEAERERARQDLERTRRLFGRGAATTEDLEHDRTSFRVAEASVLASQEELTRHESGLELLQIRLEDTTVVAPFDGRVVLRHVEPGEWVRPGDPVVTLVSSGSIEAWLEVPERFASQLALDETGIEVVVGDEDRLRKTTKVERVPEVDSRARTFHLIAELDSEEGVLIPGMSVKAWLPVGPRATQLTVPRDALRRTGLGATLFKAAPSQGGPAPHTAVPVQVRVLFEAGNRVAVETPMLQPGDLVVVEGNERLFPQTPLAVRPDADRDEDQADGSSQERVASRR